MSIYLLEPLGTATEKPFSRILIWADDEDSARKNAETPPTLAAKKPEPSIPVDAEDFSLYQDPNRSTCTELQTTEYEIINDTLLTCSIKYNSRIYVLQKDKSEMV